MMDYLVYILTIVFAFLFWLSLEYDNEILGFLSSFGITCTAIFMLTTNVSLMPLFYRISIGVIVLGVGFYVMFKAVIEIINRHWAGI